MRHLLAVMLLALALPQAYAGNADFGVNCTGPQCAQAFHDVAQDLGAAFNYKTLAPAEATGLTGIGVGAIASYTTVKNDSAWKTLTGSDVNAIGFVGGAVSKGLPFGIDAGAFYTTVPGTGASFYGGQLRYAILEGGVAEPALAVAASYSKSSGIDDFDYHAWGIDALLSKGFAFLTPYAGVGYVSAKANPSGSLKTSLGLQNQTVDNTRLLIGLRVSLLILEITPEYERVGDNNTYNLRLGFSF